MRAVIIGSGFGGLGAAIRLKDEGVDDLVILERAGSVGGTWRDNHYPGAACDIPAHLYSYSYELKPDWSTVYPRQPEIREYLEHVTDTYDLRRHLEFDAEVVAARFDESRAVWEVETADGRTFEGEVLIAAPGPLSDPKIPDIPGREDFEGIQFHSARWDHDADFENKRVGVIGTGASSIQFVPHLAEVAGELTVFQRSAPWIIPRLDAEYPGWLKTLFAKVPALQRLYRRFIYWQKELRFVGFEADSPGMKVMEYYSRWHMRRHVSDPELREKLEADYRMGCKRILISSDYYPALDRPHVEVETASIERITPKGILLEGGREILLDAIVWGTGFDVANPLGDLDIRGLDGRRLDEVWDPVPKAHQGTTIPGFPNAFLVLGPNTGLGHNSMIYMMESQYNYIADAVRRLRDPDVAYLDVKEEAMEEFAAEVTERNQELVWATGCRSWYLSEGGYNFALWPGWTFEYRKRTRDLDLDNYRLVARSEVSGASTTATATSA